VVKAAWLEVFLIELIVLRVALHVHMPHLYRQAQKVELSNSPNPP
jgi:hypothetical protein